MPNAPEPAGLLSREKILRAALDLLEREGVAAVSMRRVANQLGCKAMSLYAHVNDKEDLLDGVVELAFADFPVPSSGSWKERLRSFGLSFRAWVLQHPEAFTLLSTRPLPAGKQLRLLESCLSVFRESGLDHSRILVAFHTLAAFVYGALLSEVQLTHPTTAHREKYLKLLVAQLEAGGADGFPSAYPVREGLVSRDFAEDYAFGLEVILAGIAEQVSRK